MSVVLPNDISIPGCTDIEIGVVIRGEVAGGTMIVERRVFSQEPSILLATAVVVIQEDTTNPLVPIWLLNLSPDSVTVHKGTRVASEFALEITQLWWQALTIITLLHSVMCPALSRNDCGKQ